MITQLWVWPVSKRILGAILYSTAARRPDYNTILQPVILLSCVRLAVGSSTVSMLVMMPLPAITFFGSTGYPLDPPPTTFNLLCLHGWVLSWHVLRSKHMHNSHVQKRCQFCLSRLSSQMTASAGSNLPVDQQFELVQAGRLEPAVSQLLIQAVNIHSSW